MNIERPYRVAILSAAGILLVAEPAFTANCANIQVPNSGRLPEACFWNSCREQTDRWFQPHDESERNTDSPTASVTVSASGGNGTNVAAQLSSDHLYANHHWPQDSVALSPAQIEPQTLFPRSALDPRPAKIHQARNSSFWLSQAAIQRNANPQLGRPQTSQSSVGFSLAKQRRNHHCRR
jgi:hypothetical protein